MKCKIQIIPRDKRTKWLVIETETYAILKVRAKDYFYLHPESKKGELLETRIDGKLIINLIIKDKHGFKQIYDYINKKTLKRKQFVNFCNQFGTSELIQKFNNYLEMK